jgi:Mg-chelatase subunit ChlD
MNEKLVKSCRPQIVITRGSEEIKERLRRQVQANIEAEKSLESLILCLDVSGSMNMPFSFRYSETRIAALKIAANILVDASDSHGCIIGVTSYSGSATEVSPMTADYEKLKCHITKMQTGALTYMGEGLLHAAKQLGERRFGSGRIILLSDGAETIHDFTKSAKQIVLGYIKPCKIRVDCIGIGEEVDVDLLQWIAKQTGGVFLHPMNPQELNKDFLQLETRARMLLSSGD